MVITYLTIENINSGLFRNQVINKLEAILESSNDIHFEIIVFNSPLLFFKNAKVLNEYKVKLPSRIKIRYYSVLPPLRFALSSVLQSSLLLGWLTLVMRFIKVKGEVIHCRSYWPAIIALRATNKPVLFDVRSLYPAESVAAGKFDLDSKAYKYWLEKERFCLEKSKVISVVSEPMTVYINKICPTLKVSYNPIIVNTKQIFFDESERTKVREFLGWTNNVIIVYSGSLGYNGLNKSALGPLLNKLSGLDKGFRFLFLTNENMDSVKSFLESYSINETFTYITESSNLDLYKWLSASDIGLHALPKQLDSDTRLGTKVVEYWANGLPVILNENVGAAVSIALNEGIGITINESDQKELSSVLEEIETLLKFDRNNISHLGRSMFDSTTIGKQYLQNYEDCLKN